MNILIETKINKNYKLIFLKFNIDLFKALKPPFVHLNLERFDGLKIGDEIHLQLDFSGKFRQKWVSVITQNFSSDEEIYFVDSGKILPTPLVKWKHTHRIKKIGENSSSIIDDIEYSTGNHFVDMAIYPTLYLIFFFRKHIYQKELS